MSTEVKPTPCPSCGTDVRGRFCPACGTLARETPCRSCGSLVAAGERFCGECGTAVSTTGGAVPLEKEPWRPSTTWKVATGALAVTLVVALFLRFSGDAPASAAPFAQGAMPQGGAPGGPSAGVLSMSPQQQADALFDRVMRLSEEGKRDSVQFFAPMALAVYDQLQPLDLDQRFDLGTIALAAGMHGVARAQADSILKKDPDHLLGLALLSRTGRASGNTADVERADSRFVRIVETEVKNAPQKLEYQRHKGDIEVEVRRLAGDPK